MTRFITFTGAQGTGKTTMRKMLIDKLVPNYNVMDQYYGISESVARDAKVLGFKINERTNFLTQYYIAHHYIAAELETRLIAERDAVDFVILDRSPLDVIPYSNVSKGISAIQKSLIEFTLLEHFKRFPTDLVYCMPLDFIEDDKLRSTDKEFQLKIAMEFDEVMLKASGTKTLIRLENLPVNKRFEWLIDRLNL